MTTEDIPPERRIIRPRRPHRKSRLGCGNCKRRRIKCDERNQRAPTASDTWFNLIYTSAVLIGFVYFGRGPRLGEYLVFSDAGHAEWLVRLRGVRSILESRRDEIFTGVLDSRAEHHASLPAIPASLQGELQDHKFHIQKIQRLVERTLADGLRAVRALYMSISNDLLQSFDEVYKARAAQWDVVGLMHIVTGWLYRLPEEFISLLEHKDLFARTILAHWTILLKYLRSVWFIEGWDEHVFSGIQRSLNEDSQQWTGWPMEQILGD
ncbi:hypothetical protein VTO42DRAFT_8288 [Malbranchea cinnamomea]